MEIIYQIVTNIIIYMLLTTVVVNLLGKSSYKKYLDIFVGMLLILVLITPVLRALKISDKFDFFLKSNEFSVQSKELKDKMDIMEKDQAELMVKEFEKTIEGQIKEFVEIRDFFYVDSSIKLTDTSEEGEKIELEELNIIVSRWEDNKEENKTENLKIDKVNISKITIEDESQSVYKQIEEYKDKKENNIVLNDIDIESLKKDLSDFYHLSENNINISIQE